MHTHTYIYTYTYTLYTHTYLYVYSCTCIFVCIYLHMHWNIIQEAMRVSWYKRHEMYESHIEYIEWVALAEQVTGWRRLIGSPKLQIIFHIRATKYRSLLRKIYRTDLQNTCLYLLLEKTFTYVNRPMYRYIPLQNTCPYLYTPRKDVYICTQTNVLTYPMYRLLCTCFF